jgi:hypothetical protein
MKKGRESKGRLLPKFLGVFPLFFVIAKRQIAYLVLFSFCSPQIFELAFGLENISHTYFLLFLYFYFLFSHAAVQINYHLIT